MKAKLLLILLLTFTSLSANDIYRDSLIRWEGYSEKVYICPAGKHTVGVGHNLDANKQQIRVYSKSEIDAFYQSDVTKAVKTAQAAITNYDALPDDTKRVVISVIFTVGADGFTKFKKFRAALSSRDYIVAAYELKNSKWWLDVAPSRATNHHDVLLKQTNS